MQLLIFANALFWASGDNLGLKHTVNSCKPVAFAATIQSRSQSTVEHSK